eukprot:UC1_evm1s1330
MRMLLLLPPVRPRPNKPFCFFAFVSAAIFFVSLLGCVGTAEAFCDLSKEKPLALPYSEEFGDALDKCFLCLDYDKSTAPQPASNFGACSTNGAVCSSGWCSGSVGNFDFGLRACLAQEELVDSNKRQANYVTSPLLSRTNGAEVVSVTFAYRATACQGGLTCVNNLQVSTILGAKEYAMTDFTKQQQNSGDADTGTDGGKSVAAVVPNTDDFGRWVETTVQVPIVSAPTFRVAWKDAGGCLAITNLTIAAAACPQLDDSALSATFPRTLERAKPVSEAGVCGAGLESGPQGPPLRICSGGIWGPLLIGSCVPEGTAAAAASSDNNNDNGGGGAGAIAGGVVGGLLALLLIMVLVHRQRSGYWMWAGSRHGGGRRGMSSGMGTGSKMHRLETINMNVSYDAFRQRVSRGEAEGFEGSSMYEDPSNYSDPSELTAVIRARAREVSRSDVTLQGTIGKGEFGEVMHAVVELENTPEIDTAVKTLRKGASAADRVEFLKEAAIMSQFSHENVIMLLGVVLDGEPVMIVTELMTNGALRDYVADRRGQIPLDRQLALIRDVADGMTYLSSLGFVHRDLAARNILVAENLVCKVADFGLSKEVDETEYFVSNGGKIPIRWTAPEAMTARKYTTSSDVWSFGVLAWEVLAHGQRPYDDLDNINVFRKVEKGHRLPVPDGCPRAVYAVLLACWAHRRRARPTFSALLEAVTTLQGKAEADVESLDCEWSVPPADEEAAAAEAEDKLKKEQAAAAKKEATTAATVAAVAPIRAAPDLPPVAPKRRSRGGSATSSSSSSNNNSIVSNGRNGSGSGGGGGGGGGVGGIGGVADEQEYAQPQDTVEMATPVLASVEAPQQQQQEQQQPQPQLQPDMSYYVAPMSAVTAATEYSEPQDTVLIETDERPNPAPRRRSTPAVAPPPPQLPKGWEALKDAEGSEYYLNVAEGTTQWEHPSADSSAA